MKSAGILVLTFFFFPQLSFAFNFSLRQAKDDNPKVYEQIQDTLRQKEQSIRQRLEEERYKAFKAKAEGIFDGFMTLAAQNKTDEAVQYFCASVAKNNFVDKKGRPQRNAAKDYFTFNTEKYEYLASERISFKGRGGLIFSHALYLRSGGARVFSDGQLIKLFDCTFEPASFVGPSSVDLLVYLRLGDEHKELLLHVAQRDKLQLSHILMWSRTEYEASKELINALLAIVAQNGGKGIPVFKMTLDILREKIDPQNAAAHAGLDELYKDAI
ncbi:MAG: hypothetical protein LBR90_00255 [Elusimicrobiota bacterium]|jgi:hypothetical protein|nr:hypothetical protein [Elusimicrobiota bacterium]